MEWDVTPTRAHNEVLHVLATQDVELQDVIHGLAEVVRRVKPRRAVVDSIGAVRLLAGGRARYQAEIVTLRLRATDANGLGEPG